MASTRSFSGYETLHHILGLVVLVGCAKRYENLTIEQAQAHLKDKRVDIVYGKNDPYLTSSTLEKIHDHLQTLQIKYEILEFEGVHEINQKALESISAST